MYLSVLTLTLFSNSDTFNYFLCNTVVGKLIQDCHQGWTGHADIWANPRCATLIFVKSAG